MKNLSREQMERFLRTETSREENQTIVRQLLSGAGTELAQAVATRTGVASALSRFGTARTDRSLEDPDRYAQAFARLLGTEVEAAPAEPTRQEWSNALALVS